MIVVGTEAVAIGVSPERSQLSSVGKALMILDAFEGPTLMLGVSEVARQTRLPKSTAFRLLTSLEQRGYVERRGDQYCLGKHIFELGNSVSWCRPRSLRDIAMPYLCELFTATKHTVHLAVLDEGDVLYVGKLHGHERPATPTRVGGRVAARTTALGKAMLAYSDKATIQRALAVHPSTRTSYTVMLPSLFIAALAQVRKAGVAFDREEVRIGLSCVAAAVVVGGRPLCAISVSSTTPGFRPEQAARLVRTTADQVAHHCKHLSSA